MTDVEITDPSYDSCTGIADTPHRQLILGELAPYKVHVIDRFPTSYATKNYTDQFFIPRSDDALSSALGWVVTAPRMLLIEVSERPAGMERVH